MKVDKNKIKSGRWSFSGKVAKSFDKHVSKSVPMYHEGHDLILSYSDYFIRDDSIIYDIGCSIILLKKVYQRHKEKNKAQFIGLDVEQNMISEAK